MIITLGNEFVFASGSTEVPVVRALSDDKFVVAWRDAADNDKGKLCVGTRDGFDITYGPVATFCDATLQTGTYNTYARQCYEISVVDENNIFAIYTPSDQLAYARICQVSGNVVTSGAQYQWTGLSADTGGVTCTPTTVKTGNRIFCCQIHDSHYLHSTLATITGTSISFGTIDTINTNYPPSNVRAIKIDANRAMISYGWFRVVALTTYRAIIYDLYTTSTFPGTIKVLYTDNIPNSRPQENEPTLLSTDSIDKAIVSYTYEGTDRVAYVSINGKTITIEDEAQRLTGDPRLGAVLTKDADEFDIIYVDPNDSNCGKITHGTIIGGVPSYDSAEIWHSGATADHHACVLNYPISVIAYKDTDNSDYGTAKIVWLTGLDMASSNLFMSAHEQITNSGDLFIRGHDTIQTSINKYDKLYYSDSTTNQIISSDFNGSGIEIVVSGLDCPWGIVIDSAKNYIYWIGYTSGTINRCDIDGENSITIIEGLSSPTQMAIDYVNNHIYVNDWYGNSIKRINIDGSNLVTILDGSDGVYSPNDIDILSSSGLIFWIESTVPTGTIKSANLDGSNSQTVVSGLYAAFGLCISKADNRLYWLHRPGGIDPHWEIQSSTFDGLDITTIAFGLGTNISHIVVDENAEYVYLGDNNLDKILKIDVQNGSTEYIIDISGAAVSIDIYYPSQSVDMFIHGHNNMNESGNLFINSHESLQTSGNLFTHGHDQIGGGSGMDLFIKSHRPVSVSGDMFVHGYEYIPVSGNLFIDGCCGDSVCADLFINAHSTWCESGDLYINGRASISSSSNLFVCGHAYASGRRDMFVSAHESISTDDDLFICSIGTIQLSGNLYIGGSGIIPSVNQMNLFINGSRPIIPTTCPILDPTASIQISDTLIGIYQSRIDALINQLGKNVYLEFDPIREPCPNCTFDKIRNRSTGIYKPGGPRPFVRGRRCPFCKNKGLLETVVNKCIKCLIKWNPHDAKDFGISVSQTKGIVRLKTYLTEADDMIRAKTILTNHDIIGQMKMRVRLIRGPIPVGLREDRYCISFWELI